MCKMSLTVKNNYVIIDIKKKKIRYLVSPALSKYTEVKKLDKESGMLTLMGQINLKNGTCVNEEDWIDLTDVLGFAFAEPKALINEIDTVEIK